MKSLFLADLKNMTEAEIKAHVSENYAGKVSGFDYGEPTKEEEKELALILESYDVVVAYESVGSWGCDSSSWFLFRHKLTGQYFESHGSHNSCYGFEGQFELEETTTEYLKSENFQLDVGGYDNEEDKNKAAVKEFLHEL